MRVLIVDDSIVFRSQIKAALEGAQGIVVGGVAANGKLALDRLEQGQFDVVILDLEMPEMNGLQTLGEMRRRGLNQRVIVFASPTQIGARQAMEALRAGANDFVAKPEGGTFEQALAGAQRELVPKILQFSVDKPSAPSLVTQTRIPTRAALAEQSAAVAMQPPSRDRFRAFKPQVVAIGCSTGGPAALDRLLSGLHGRPCTTPILIVQHMPPHFTACLAKRLSDVSGLPAAEGVDGEPVRAGRIYVAPGDYHMVVRRLAEGQDPIICIDQSPKIHAVRPAVDPLFESVARCYGSQTAAFVLTGMGEDGAQGAVHIRRAKGAVMIQDKESSIVWGMPGAVHGLGACDAVGDLDRCSEVLTALVA